MAQRKRRRSPFLTTEEAADFLRLAPQTLTNMRSNNEGPEYAKHGSRVAYTIKDLIAYSRSRRLPRKK
ncbi:helix-turn-helix domain-containing protein [Hyphomicrobium sp. CS1BSMeth3]|uniref:helix-turn-helix domain-containing protein n=1 Tax=Hyphomicrobium sp. CS1BSMeth3 TaxID=1892844 RepID=UPI0009308D28|nr:helix-turn-helix domain-containing protein [Hyphomicrobium sp. CS1BSMeth3]